MLPSLAVQVALPLLSSNTEVLSPRSAGKLSGAESMWRGLEGARYLVSGWVNEQMS